MLETSASSVKDTPSNNIQTPDTLGRRTESSQASTCVTWKNPTSYLLTCKADAFDIGEIMFWKLHVKGKAFWLFVFCASEWLWAMNLAVRDGLRLDSDTG